MNDSGIRFEIEDNPDVLFSLRHDWERLCDELDNETTVFASWLWHANWWKHFHSDATVHLFLMRDHNRLVGIAPLMCAKTSFRKLPVRQIGFMQNNQSLHNDFIVLPAYRLIFLEQLIKTLNEHSSRWDFVYLRNMPRHSENYLALTRLLENGEWDWKYKGTPFDSPYLVPAVPWDDFFAGRSRIHRKNLRNLKNRIQKTGNFTVRHITTKEEFHDCKDELFSVARNSWTERVGDSLASSGNREFYESLAYAAADKGWLSIWALYCGDRMVAFEFHLRAYGREHALRGHFHHEYAHASPGTYLEMTILERIFHEESKLKQYDFCGAFDDYKKKWTDTSNPHCDIFLFKGQAYSQIIKFLEFGLVPFLKKTLLKSGS